MKKKTYKLRFLTIFEDDLNEIIDYISYNLDNPQVARKLLTEVEKTVLDRLFFPEAFEPYHSPFDRKHPYYRIYIHNYIVFYVVIDYIMEVRRIIYKKRNIKDNI
jgi:toxin ParE1/3/4